MKKLRPGLLFILITMLLALPGAALAQDLYFQVPEMLVDVYWENDGTATIDTWITFKNNPGSAPIDYVDFASPQPNYSLSNVTAAVNGNPVYTIESSPYVTYGYAVGLGQYTIQPGQTGTVYARLSGIQRVLFTSDEDPNYASAVFGTTSFDSPFVDGTSYMRVTFHLPNGVQPEEPRWYKAPSGFNEEPYTGFDDAGRITYTWESTSADTSEQYKFGAAFPYTYVPKEEIYTPTFSDRTQIPTEDIFGFIFCFGFAGFFILIFVVAAIAGRKRQMAYLPPKISIEGHGIKRGLTAIEAAILMEQPMDKIMTMILFAVLKKEAAQVISRDPLDLEVYPNVPEGLHQYELDFLDAFREKDKAKRRKLTQSTMVDLVQSVSKKMKGFSRKETIAYYEDIMRKAWAQIEAAGTPEVVSEKYDDVMEWTMLDRKYEDRTREVFKTRPVYVPTWWWRYDPVYAAPGGGFKSAAKPSSSGGSSGGGGLSMPQLPGADFAASVVGGIQNFSSGVIGNLTDFTSSITERTNPVPKSTSSGGGFKGGSGGGRSSCACACACAGCACACAGGGR